jgi:hypothetical protein
MLYNKEDFRKCQFNPFEKNLFKAYPRLLELVADFEEDALPAEKESILRYVIALYDPASPIVKDYPDLQDRKMAAAGVAELDIADDDKIRVLFECSSDPVAQIILGFLKNFVQNRLWSMIISNEQAFWEYNLRMLTAISADRDKDLMSAVAIKTKLSDDLEAINNRLERFLSNFYGDDSELKKKAQKRGHFTPEDMAGVK